MSVGIVNLTACLKKVCSNRRILKVSSESAMMNPPSRPTFKVKIKREGPADELVSCVSNSNSNGMRTARAGRGSATRTLEIG